MKSCMLYLNDHALAPIRVADSYFLRLRGLIGRNVEQLGGLWIRPCNQIHMFFMSSPIDAVYLDRSKAVVKVDANVPVGIVCPVVKGAKSVLELPAGSAAKMGILPGTALEIR